MRNSRLKISLVVPSLRSGGAERSMVLLARGLNSLAHEIEIIVCGSGSGPYRDEIPRGVLVTSLGYKHVYTCLSSLALRFRSTKPDLIIAGMGLVNVVSSMAASLALSDAQKLLIIRNTISLSQARRRGWRAVVVTAMERIAYERACVAAVSFGAARDAERVLDLPKGHIKVVPNAVVIPELERLAAEPLPERALADRQGPVVVACGRLHEQKDYPTLLAAFARLRAEAACQLHILGEGPLRGALEELASALGVQGSVRFLGFDPNPFRHMKRADLFVMSSRWEGFGNVLVQALACGCRVVSTDCPSGPREILRGGQFGRLVPVGDVGALADAMIASLQHRQSSSPDALADLLERHSLEGSARAHLELLGTAGPEIGRTIEVSSIETTTN